MTVTRRTLLGSGLVAGASLVTSHGAAQPAPAPHQHPPTSPAPPGQPPVPATPPHEPPAPPTPPAQPHQHPAPPTPPAQPHQHPVPPSPAAPEDPPALRPTRPPLPSQSMLSGHRLVVPNGSLLPWTVQRGVKIFHLRAEPVRHQIAPGLDIFAWGYNGVTPGPVIEAIAGDRVRIYVTNQLPEPTSIHWHGVLVPYGMDGVTGLTQEPIAPGKTFRYEFVFDRPGTFMYHPHADEMTQIALGMMG